MFILRYIGLFLLCVLRDSGLVYRLKYILFLNHITIPLMVIGLSYVYLRWDKLTFNVNYILASILIICYGIEIYFMKAKVTLDINYGYIVNITNKNIIYLFPLIMVGILLVFCIYFFDKPNNNKAGMIYLILGLSVVIIENIIYLGGIKIFPYPIIGDGIFVFIMNLAVNTFKKLRIEN
ncbi:MAG: hypothetical protein PUE01_13220 [Clostridiaceae bacterium]|nr:hypothetical protein [Clostridiaceae bacterium]